jgi:hypothetical protein
VTKVGINVNQQATNGQWPLVTTYTVRARPSTMLVMDGVAEALQLLELNPGCVVVHRASYQSEADDWKNESPESYVNRIRKMTPDSRLWHYISNEPSAGDDYNAIRQMFNWYATVARLCAEKGIRAVVGNWPSGATAEHHLEAGLVDEYLRAMAEVSDSEVYAGYHEYTVGHAGMGPHVDAEGRERGIDWLLNPMNSNPSRWTKQITAKEWPGRTASLGYPPHYHIGRHTWFQLRADRIGVKRHKVLITECWLDRMGDVGSHNARFTWGGQVGTIYDHLSSQVNNQFGGYPELRGHLTYRDVYNRLWKPHNGGINYERYMAQQLDWLGRVYDENVIGLHMFTLNYNPEWDYPGGFNIGRTPDMIEEMIQYAQEGAPVITPTPDYVWRGAFVSAVHSSGSTNVRADRSASAPLLGSVQVGDAIEIGFVNGVAERVTANGFTWQTVRYNGQRAFIGGAFGYKLDATGPLPEPDPDPEPEPEPEPEPPNADEIDRVAIEGCHAARNREHAERRKTRR